MSRNAIALVVGINQYDKAGNLFGCVNDAKSVKEVLARHGNGEGNFDVQLCIATSDQTSNPSKPITRKVLKKEVENLFSKKADIVLFYFSGHGYIENSGGYLITSECQHGDDGLPLHELLRIANNSPATNKVIILDCCHAGYTGRPSADEKNSALSEGLTILTASSENQYAIEKYGSGVFTSLLVDALKGNAANLVGDITPGSVYAHIDQSLAWWKQRPTFKTNVSNFTSLRKVKAPLSLSDLKRITELFPNKRQVFELDPTYEPERCPGDQSSIPSPIPEHVEKFEVLQKYNRVNLVVPVDAPHMYHAAMESKGCKLTMLGQFYWRLVNAERI